MADQNQNDPYFMFRDEEWKKATPIWEQYATFALKTKDDPKWAMLPPEAKARIYQKGFGVSDPIEIFKTPEAAQWDKDTFTRMTAAYLQNNEQFSQIQDPQKRLELRMNFQKKVADYHAGVRQEINLFEEQRRQEVMDKQLEGQMQQEKQLEEAGMDTLFEVAKVSPEKMAKDITTGGMSKAVISALDNLGHGRPALSEKPEGEEMSGLGQRAEALYGAAVGGGQRAVGQTMRFLGEKFDNEWLKVQGEVGSEGGAARYAAFRRGDLDPEKMWQGDLGSTMDLILQESGPMLIMAATTGALGSTLTGLGLGGGTGLWASKLLGKVPLIGKSPWARQAVGRAAARLGDAFPFAATMRLTEGAMEAGGAFEEALLRGDPGAVDVADAVLAGNTVYLGGADLIQTALLFSAIPGGKQLNRLIPKNSLLRMPVRTAWIAAKLAITGEMEGLEEVQQEEIQAWAKGDGYDLRTLTDPKHAAEKHPEAFNLGRLTSLAMSGPLLTMEQVEREISGEGLAGPIEPDFDVRGVGREFAGAPPTDQAPAPREFEPPAEPAKEPEDVRQRPPYLDEEQAQFYDTLTDEQKDLVNERTNELFNERMNEAMREEGLKPEEAAMFPENQEQQIGQESYRDALDELRSQLKPEIAPEAAEQPSERAEEEGRTPAPGAPAPEKPAVAAPTLKAKETKDRIGAATTLDELDEIEAEWQERGNPKATTVQKKIDRRREQLSLEQAAEVPDEELGVQEVKETKPISELAEDSFVRYTDPEGRVIEGQVRHDEEGEQVAIETKGGEFTYVDPDTDVGVLTEYDKPKTPKPKEKKELPKFGGTDLTIEEWSDDYESQFGERPSDKKLYEYLTGEITQSVGGPGKKSTEVVGPQLENITLRDVKNARKQAKGPAAEAKPEPEAEVKPKPKPKPKKVVVEEPKPVDVHAPVDEDTPGWTLLDDMLASAEQNAMDTAEPDSREYAEVEAATLISRAEEEGVDIFAVDDERVKRVLGAVEKEKPAEKAKPKPKPKAEPKKKAKPKAEPKKKAKPPADKAKAKPSEEAKPNPKVKKQTRKAAPKELRQDRNGATFLEDLKAIIADTDDVETIEAAEAVYLADVEHKRRRKSTRFENFVDKRLGDIFKAEKKAEEEADKAKKAKAKAKPEKKKLTEDEEIERLNRQINAPWEHWREDPVEDDLGYIADIDDPVRLAAEIVDELMLGWRKLNGVEDYMDPTFFGQVMDSLEEINPLVAEVRQVVYDELANPVDEAGEAVAPIIDENRQLRLFLAQEYPGATTLKQAEGEPQSNRLKKTGGPRSAFQEWLELGEIEIQDAEPRRAAALEKMEKAPKAGLTVKEEDRSKVPHDERTRAASFTDSELGIAIALERDNTSEDTSQSWMRALTDELARRRETNPDLKVPTIEEVKESLGDEASTEDLMDALRDALSDSDIKLSSAEEKLVRLRLEQYGKPIDIAAIERVFPKEYFSVEEAQEGRRWVVTHNKSGAKVTILRGQQEFLVRMILGNKNILSRLKFETRKKTLDDIVDAMLAKYTRLIGGKKSRTGAVAGFYTHLPTSEGIDGTHIIAVDERIGDEQVLLHEAFHYAYLNFLAPEEQATVDKVLNGEENGAQFMELFLRDKEAAMDSIRNSGSKQDVSRIRKIYNKIISLFGELRRELGLTVENIKDPKAVIRLARLIDGLLTGNAFENYYGPRGRSISASIQDSDARVDQERLDVEQQNVPEGIPDQPLDLQQDQDTRNRGVSAADGNPQQLRAIENRRAERTKAKIKQLFFKNRGVPPGLRKRVIEAQRANSAGKAIAHAANSRMKRIIKQLKDEHGEDRVSRSLSQVLDGRMPLSQFARIYRLDENDSALESIRFVLNRQAEVRSMLAVQPHFSEELRRQILANEYYQTRFYALHILGNGYIAQSDHFQTAVDAMSEAHENEVDRILRKAGETIGRRDPFDFGRFMAEDHQGRARMLEGLSRTKAQAMQRLARALDPWYSAIEEINMESGSLSAVWNTQLLQEIAVNTVQGYLDTAIEKGKRLPGPIGGVPMANRMHRKLDRVFRDLYGEITSPGERLARTIEVQNNLLATSVMFQKILEEGEKFWWSGSRSGRFTHRLSASQSMGQPTPQDWAMFGNLAGKYVTKETYDLLMGSGIYQQKALGPVMELFQKVQAITRGTRLLWPKTVIRNYLTAVTGFAFGSGDILEKNYAKHFQAGNVLMGRVMKEITFPGKDPEALEALAELVRQDIFDTSQETMLQAIQENLKGVDLKGWYGKRLRDAMTMYAVIDLPAKYAAYHVRRDKGDSHAEAVEHVHKFYQYRDNVPEWIGKLNRIGLGDYFGYTWDSTRIWVNQIGNAAVQASKGNIRPLLGLMMRLIIPTFNYGTGSLVAYNGGLSAVQFAISGIGNILAALGLKDDEDDELFRIASDDEVAALRDTLPSYDRYMPLAVWYERKSPEDEWTLKWRVLGNLSAFPIEDIILGAFKASGQDPDKSFTQILARNLWEASPIRPGMTPQNVMTLLFGADEDLVPKRGDVGVGHIAVDAMTSMGSDKRMMSDWDFKLGERLAQFTFETFAPGQTYTFIDRTLQWLGKRDPMIGRMRETVDGKDIFRTFTRLVRDYDIKPETQERLLGDMIAKDVESYQYEKNQAGKAGRADMTWEQGHNAIELMLSERGRENWHHALKTIQKKVKDFRVLTKGQVSDQEIASYLQDRGIRKAEAQYIINGTVQDMTIGDFEFRHRPGKLQRGDALILNYFEERKGKRINMREIHSLLAGEGYLVGEFDSSFRSRVRRLRKEWHTSGK